MTDQAPALYRIQGVTGGVAMANLRCFMATSPQHGPQLCVFPGILIF